MNRAERRRRDRKQRKEEAVYNLSQSQLNAMIHTSIEKELKKIKEDATNVATNSAMALTLCLPLVVLIDKYMDDFGDWTSKDVEGFADYLLDYYTQWQDGKITLQDMDAKVWDVIGIKFVRDEE